MGFSPADSPTSFIPESAPFVIYLYEPGEILLMIIVVIGQYDEMESGCQEEESKPRNRWRLIVAR